CGHAVTMCTPSPNGPTSEVSPTEPSSPRRRPNGAPSSPRTSSTTGRSPPPRCGQAARTAASSSRVTGVTHEATLAPSAGSSPLSTHCSPANSIWAAASTGSAEAALPLRLGDGLDRLLRGLDEGVDLVFVHHQRRGEDDVVADEAGDHAALLAQVARHLAPDALRGLVGLAA